VTEPMRCSEAAEWTSGRVDEWPRQGGGARSTDCSVDNGHGLTLLG
jgi:hypothetical protein